MRYYLKINNIKLVKNLKLGFQIVPGKFARAQETEANDMRSLLQIVQREIGK